MRAAPPVTVALHPCRRWLMAAGALAGASAAAAAATVAAHLEASSEAQAIAVALALPVGVALLARLAPRSSGRLRWDGAQWWYAPDAGADEQSGELSVMIDLGGWMLLRFHSRSSGRRSHAWLPVASAGLGVAWHGLRAAIYSRRLDADTAQQRAGDAS